MPVLHFKKLLDAKGIKYRTLKQVDRIEAHSLAKSIFVQLDNTIVMAIIAADQHIQNLDLLKIAAHGARSAQFLNENEMSKLFPDCEIGAMPVFGDFYNVQIYADRKITHHHDIAFNVGSHAEVIILSVSDYIKLAKPIFTTLCAH